MARPSKRVPPDTLGGRIRAARQNLRLSLADVAKDHYSTSLISQIERNRVDPSVESLQFLSERLEVPLAELLFLMQQRRDSEAEAHRYKEFEEIRAQAWQLLEGGRPQFALDSLKKINPAHTPTSLRWRIIALRGQCYFSLRQFLPALRDFLSAAGLQPDPTPADQLIEATILHLHLAAASRELGQLTDAYKHYQDALNMMKTQTPLHYIAEAHWGMALVAYEQATGADNGTEHSPQEEEALKKRALNHAGHASALYRSIGETLRAALLACQVGLIEQALGNIVEARRCLQEVLDSWASTLDEAATNGTHENGQNAAEKRSLKERANIVSAAACYLAGIELTQHNHPEALRYARQAQEAAQKSYILRRAEADLVLGQILEDHDLQDPAAEEAFRAAIEELNSTDRIAAKIRAHDLLGRHLLKKGKIEEGEKVLNQVRKLSQLPPLLTSATTSAEDTF